MNKDPRRLQRLIKSAQWCAILSENEAVSAIVAYRQNDRRYGGSEAVVHYGGPAAVLHNAWTLRHRFDELQKIWETSP